MNNKCENNVSLQESMSPYSMVSYPLVKVLDDIVLFILAIIVILVIFALAQARTTIVTVKTPSMAKYRQLQAKYPDALNCPCATVTIPYEAFASVEFSLHEICSSIFVTDEWIAALHTPDANRYLPTDFRSTGSAQVYCYSDHIWCSSTLYLIVIVQVTRCLLQISTSYSLRYSLWFESYTTHIDKCAARSSTKCSSSS